MQIYGIKNNSTTNFQALRIPKENGKSNLSKIGQKNFEMLDYVGEYLKDTKYYHLYITKDIYIREISGQRLNGPYTVQQAGKSLMIGYKTGYEQSRLKLDFDSTKASETIKNDITNSTTQIERTAKIVKCLDDYKKKKSESNTNVIINPNDTYDEKIEKLINKYGV